MSPSISQSFVKQFEREVHEAYQRMGSKLRMSVRTINNVEGATAVFQKVGKPRAWPKLKKPVGNGQQNQSEDVKNVQRLLTQIGKLAGVKDTNPTGVLDASDDKAIKQVQQENGLKVDGLLKPRGETEMMLSRLVKEKDKKTELKEIEEETTEILTRPNLLSQDSDNNTTLEGEDNSKQVEEIDVAAAPAAAVAALPLILGGALATGTAIAIHNGEKITIEDLQALTGKVFETAQEAKEHWKKLLTDEKDRAAGQILESRSFNRPENEYSREAKELYRDPKERCQYLDRLHKAEKDENKRKKIRKAQKDLGCSNIEKRSDRKRKK